MTSVPMDEINGTVREQNVQIVKHSRKAHATTVVLKEIEWDTNCNMADLSDCRYKLSFVS